MSTRPAPSSAAGPRGIGGLLIIPALLQPLWAILQHLDHAREVIGGLRLQLAPVDQLIILAMAFLLLALALTWCFAIWLAFRSDPRFPPLYGLLILGEVVTAVLMVLSVFTSPHTAIGGMLLVAGAQFVLGGIFVPYLRTSRRATTTFAGCAGCLPDKSK